MTLVAATKTVPPECINEAIRCGVRVIGENRVQELLEKYDAIDRANVQVHFIGQLQTNKVKYIADKVDMIQSLDSLPLAREIEKRCAALGRTMGLSGRGQPRGRGGEGRRPLRRNRGVCGQSGRFSATSACGVDDRAAEMRGKCKKVRLFPKNLSKIY